MLVFCHICRRKLYANENNDGYVNCTACGTDTYYSVSKKDSSTNKLTTPEHYRLNGRDVHSVERELWGDIPHSQHLVMAAFEYVARYDKKGSPIKDLEKAVDCLNKAIAILKDNKCGLNSGDQGFGVDSTGHTV